ncbi:hypothetical protein FNV43_RR19273 [Rhamnella rubrinervis]|uniref:non-specific serine/threonine protein kinase n=1 Tax=Rhamnella rubrinervis TaxID=2594499 RepID=A0A8K0E0I7_9ROSA|nr:hypothetical protein FNV43_RR19273 [Rhamnella rubrinervis]
MFRTIAYSHIAAGKNHVCAIRGLYYSEHDSGSVDCWEIVRTKNNSLSSKQSTLLYDQSINSLVFKKVVSGEGFSCGVIREGGLVCGGPNFASLGVSDISDSFMSINPLNGTRFVSLAAGALHFCGVRKDNHGVECWGSFNASSILKGSGFMAIASSDFRTCGIREDDLVVDSWVANASASTPVVYDPPLEFCSPDLCTPGSCGDKEFAFNASILHEPDLTSLCARRDLKICSPCGSNCSEGFFLSSPCTKNADIEDALLALSARTALVGIFVGFIHPPR